MHRAKSSPRPCLFTQHRKVPLLRSFGSQVRDDTFNLLIVIPNSFAEGGRERDLTRLLHYHEHIPDYL